MFKNLSNKARAWWIVSIILYLASSIGLIAGLKSGLEMGLAGTEGVSMSPTWASIIAFMIGISINIIETLMIIDYKNTSVFDKFVTFGLLILDFSALFIALGGHTNIIWLVQNETDTAGNVVHIFGLIMQVISGFLGAFFAEYSFKIALDVSGKKVDLHDQLHQTKTQTLDPAAVSPAPFSWIKNRPRPTQN